jgi:hypothetical protein
MWAREVELGHSVIRGNYNADWFGHRFFLLTGKLTSRSFDLKAKLPYDTAMKSVGFFVSPGFQMLDLAGPAGAFEAASGDGGPSYRIHVLSADAGGVSNSLDMETATA